MADTTSKELVLDELRNAYEKQFSASDTLDGKLQNILNFISIVVSVAPTLELMLIPDPKNMGFAFVVVLLVVVVLYLISFVKIMGAVNPVYYRQPVSRTWDELYKRFILSTSDKAMDLIISEYLYSMDAIHQKHEHKIKTIKHVSALMATIVVLLLFAVPVNMFLPHPTMIELFQLFSR